MILSKCQEKKIECFAYGERGNCRALCETSFKHGCPFFKTSFNRKMGHLAALQRLREIGRQDLIEKYSEGEDQRRVWEGI